MVRKPTVYQELMTPLRPMTTYGALACKQCGAALTTTAGGTPRIMPCGGQRLAKLKAASCLLLSRVQGSPCMVAMVLSPECGCSIYVLRLAWKEGLLEKLPAVELFPEDNERDRILAEAEFHTLHETAATILNLIFVTAWETGIRGGKILLLTWPHVNFKDNLIRQGLCPL